MSPAQPMIARVAGAQEGGGKHALASMRATQPDETDKAQPNRERDDDPQDDDLFHGIPHSNASTQQLVKVG